MLVTLFLIVFSLLLYFTESVTYSGFITKHFHIHPIFVVLFTCFVLIYQNIGKRISGKWIFFLTISALFSLILSLVLTLIEILTPANYIFSSLHIHPDLSILIGLILSLYSVLSLNFSFIKKNIRFVLLISPVWLLAFVTAFWLYYPSLYYYFKVEDSAIEYLTFIAYLAAVFFGLRSLGIIIKDSGISGKTKFIYAFLYILITIGSFVIAAEEISWGQRIIGFRTPQDLAFQNQQKEFNFHNSQQFMIYIYHIFALLTFCGASGWVWAKLAIKYFPKSVISKLLKFFSPPWYTVNFFLLMFIFSVTRLIQAIPELSNYPEETLEFILGAGIAITVYLSFKKILAHQKKLNLLLG